MKQALKKIIPQGMINTGRQIRDRSGLALMPSCALDPAFLRTASAFPNPATLFSDPKISAGWEKDNARAAALFSENTTSGGINPGDRRALYYLIRALKPRKTLEIGTHIGASSLFIALALAHTAPEAALTTVDIVDVNDPQNGPWKGAGQPRPPREMAAHLGCADRIKFETGAAQSYMEGTKERFDLVFLDGDHSAAAVYREASLALLLLNPGGVILLHDYYPQGQALFPDGSVITGPFMAVRRINEENSGIFAFPLGALPWSTKQGSRKTSLAVLLRED